MSTRCRAFCRFAPNTATCNVQNAQNRTKAHSSTAKHHSRPAPAPPGGRSAAPHGTTTPPGTTPPSRSAAPHHPAPHHPAPSHPAPPPGTTTRHHHPAPPPGGRSAAPPPGQGQKTTVFIIYIIRGRASRRYNVRAARVGSAGARGRVAGSEAQKFGRYEKFFSISVGAEQKNRGLEFESQTEKQGVRIWMQGGGGRGDRLSPAETKNTKRIKYFWENLQNVTLWHGLGGKMGTVKNLRKRPAGNPARALAV